MAQPDEALAQLERRRVAGMEGHERLDGPDQPLERFNIAIAITHSSSIHKHVYGHSSRVRRRRSRDERVPRSRAPTRSASKE